MTNFITKLPLTLIAFLSITFSGNAFSETMLVTGKRLLKQPDKLGNATGAESGSGMFRGSGGSNGTGGGGGGGIRVGCQECQSSTALYSCKVWKVSPVNEVWDKTLNALKGQNCCSAQGGSILSTKLGNCG